MKEIISNQSNDLSNEAQQMADVQMIEKIKKGFENNEFKMHLQFVMDNKKTGGVSLPRKLSPAGKTHWAS